MFVFCCFLFVIIVVVVVVVVVVFGGGSFSLITCALLFTFMLGSIL